MEDAHNGRSAPRMRRQADSAIETRNRASGRYGRCERCRSNSRLVGPEDKPGDGDRIFSKGAEGLTDSRNLLSRAQI